MRPIALLGLTLTLTLPLAGCGDTWWNPPLTGGYNPHAPVVDSVNMRRVMGQDAPVATLDPEPGDVWPGPLPAAPTLRDMESRPSAGQPLAGAGSTGGTGSGIVVPNGNGTSTVIHPDGHVETIPSPR